MKFVGMFIGKEREAYEVFAGIEQRYNDLKLSVQRLVLSDSTSNTQHPTPNTQLPTVTSGEMHYGTWHAVGGKNY